MVFSRLLLVLWLGLLVFKPQVGRYKINLVITSAQCTLQIWPILKILNLWLFCDLILGSSARRSSDSLQAIGVKLVHEIYNNGVSDGKLYVSGDVTKSTDANAANYKESCSAWCTNTSKIITWINSSVDQSILYQLSAKEIWDYLSRLYFQSSNRTLQRDIS